MKLVFILFGLCAFTAPTLGNQDVAIQPESFDLGTVVKDLLEIIKLAITELENVLEQAKQIVGEIAQQIRELYKDIARRIGEFMQEIDRIIEELQKEGIVKKECIKKYLPKIQEVRSNAKKNLKKCGSDAVDELKAVHEHLKGQVASINEVLKNLRNSVKQCIQINPLEFVKCLREKSEEIKEQVRSIIKIASEATTDAAQEVKKISKEHKECSQTVVSNAKSELGKIVGDIKKCSEEN